MAERYRGGAVPLPELLLAGRFAGSRDVPLHCHAGCELVLVAAGSCTLVAGEAVIEAAAGAVAVLPAGVPHLQRDPGPARTSYICFRAPTRLFPDRPRVLRLEDDDPALAWFEQVCALCPGRPERGDDTAAALLLALLVRLGRQEERQRALGRLPPPLARAVRHLAADLTTTPPVADLATAAGISASHLANLFREHLGCGPAAYQRRQRLDLARRLLANSYLSIADVAATCGWDDANHFSRIFRAAFGHAPRHWRLERSGRRSRP